MNEWDWGSDWAGRFFHVDVLMATGLQLTIEMSVTGFGVLAVRGLGPSRGHTSRGFPFAAGPELAHVSLICKEPRDLTT